MHKHFINIFMFKHFINIFMFIVFVLDNNSLALLHVSLLLCFITISHVEPNLHYFIEDLSRSKKHFSTKYAATKDEFIITCATDLVYKEDTSA
ncbi:hypothetical protein HanPSC8_Chr03g0088431 [Helianthus annuus]|nr:hypothetical protein HanPSC8_Chr03g0088431 [Helianthus annuus]